MSSVGLLPSPSDLSPFYTYPLESISQPEVATIMFNKSISLHPVRLRSTRLSAAPSFGELAGISSSVSLVLSSKPLSCTPSSSAPPYSPSCSSFLIFSVRLSRKRSFAL
eukprot:TRINITY_DN19954_c0_g2_i1.p1 TRINITY_DN19954_c0_g2~~TRINITY_DN19954_c0_g2_i1.p1  ORF type:complete len:109 (-),score=0.82 TRINITY_DN19954_c0_g2_i1:11-337(-)